MFNPEYKIAIYDLLANLRIGRGIRAEGAEGNDRTVKRLTYLLLLRLRGFGGE